MDVITLRKSMDAAGINLVEADGLAEKTFAFDRAIKIVICPRDQSDRTCFRRISAWLVKGCVEGRFQENIIFRRVLDFALEASGPESKNPAAVFISILKKELDYPN